MPRALADADKGSNMVVLTRIEEGNEVEHCWSDGCWSQLEYIGVGMKQQGRLVRGAVHIIDMVGVRIDD